jgi:hypothetical protein
MMNGVRYQQLLDDKLEMCMQLYGAPQFLQEGAPCHKSKAVMDDSTAGSMSTSSSGWGTAKTSTP